MDCLPSLFKKILFLLIIDILCSIKIEFNILKENWKTTISLRAFDTVELLLRMTNLLKQEKRWLSNFYSRKLFIFITRKYWGYSQDPVNVPRNKGCRWGEREFGVKGERENRLTTHTHTHFLYLKFSSSSWEARENERGYFDTCPGEIRICSGKEKSWEFWNGLLYSPIWSNFTRFKSRDMLDISMSSPIMVLTLCVCVCVCRPDIWVVGIEGGLREGGWLHKGGRRTSQW